MFRFINKMILLAFLTLGAMWSMTAQSATLSWTAATEREDLTLYPIAEQAGYNRVI